MDTSRYVRHRPDNDVGRFLVGRLLGTANLKRRLQHDDVPRSVRRLLDDGACGDDELDDAAKVIRWVDRCTADVDALRFDDADVFTTNTAHVAQVLALSAAELAVLRIALLVRGLRALDRAFDFHDDELTERDLCELLARLSGVADTDVAAALSPTGVLRRAGLCRIASHSGFGACADTWLGVSRRLVRETTRRQDDPDAILRTLLAPVPPPTLARADYAHVDARLDTIERYLAAVLADARRGVNLLVHGPPGTGKTELVRWLVGRLDGRGFEAGGDDEDETPSGAAGRSGGRGGGGAARLASYTLCQLLVTHAGRGLVVFDEVEDILCDASFDDHGFRGTGSLAKHRLNRVLEDNGAPAIWITNTVLGVDPAFLRRFDLVLHLDRPPRAARERIARCILAELPLGEALLRRIAARAALTPAHLHKARRVCAAVASFDREHAERVVVEVVDGALAALGEAALGTAENASHALPSGYDAAFVNADFELERIVRHATAESNLRICLHGPSGTGKSAWGRHLAESIGAPLHVRCAADVLDMFVGGTEKNIRRAFERARADRAVLVFDEVDGFLQDRRTASRHFETTAVNQFLTSLEACEGIVVCTTNRMEVLDPATLRRFDVKVKLDWLDTARVHALLGCLLDELALAGSRPSVAETVRALGGVTLTPGDFAVVRRRARLFPNVFGWRDAVRELRRESADRAADEGRGIGFLTRFGGDEAPRPVRRSEEPLDG